MPASPRVGIDDLSVYGTTLTVAAPDIARARGRSEADLAKLELVSRSLPPAFEDPVTLAVNAAKPLFDRTPASDIGLLIVATESASDDAKPISAYIHHWLGLPESCRHVELKHACYAGTVGLRMASEWASFDPTRRALVICTDMARRLFEDSAEPAEGAGAVAMVVRQDPAVFAMGPHAAVCAREIYDVMRPTRTAEVIHSRKSLGAYLDLLEETWEGYCDQAGPDALSALRYFAYHTPLVALVRQAHRTLVDDGTPESDFDRMVRPSLDWGQRIGNTYSGSLYVALGSLAAHHPIAEPTRMGLYSYGSGSCAECFDGWLLPTAQAVVSRHRIDAQLDARRSVDVPTYETLVRQVEASLSTSHFTPDLGGVSGLYEAAYAGSGRLVLDQVEDYYRAYRWA